jgi:16S rRNA (guanine527-N7)-methyltransferase
MSAALAQALAALGLVLSDAQQKQIIQYLALLHKWNAAYNLSAIKTPEQMLVKHVFDCLAVVDPICAQLKHSLSTAAPSLLDVGSGAGLPGVVLAICRPDIQITMVDAVQKKMVFVRQVIAELNLRNAQAHGVRIQDWTATYPLITARAWTALADIPLLAGHCLEKEGVFAAMKGPRLSLEAQTLPVGWQIKQVLDIQVPQLNEARTLAFISKTSTISDA